MSKYLYSAILGLSCITFGLGYIFIYSKQFENFKDEINHNSEFYKTHDLNRDAVLLLCVDDKQEEIQKKIDNILIKWKSLDSKYNKFIDAGKKSLYPFEINEKTFKNCFENLALFAITLNALGAINNATIMVAKLNELLEEYPELFTKWKGPKSGIVAVKAIEIDKKCVVSTIEASWSMKVIFSFCTGENPYEILNSFINMVNAVESNKEEEALKHAEKINIDLLNFEHIAETLGILAKIIEANFKLGLLDKKYMM